MEGVEEQTLANTIHERGGTLCVISAETALLSHVKDVFSFWVTKAIATPSLVRETETQNI